MSRLKVLVTRPRNQADSFAVSLREAGMEPVYFPVIEIQPIPHNLALEHALLDLARFHWVIFTSANGVETVWAAMRRIKLGSFPEAVRVAAIGPKTAEALRSHQLRVDFIPPDYIAEAIVPGLGEIKGRHLLLPRAEIARKALPEAITAAGGIVLEVPVYQTLAARPTKDGVRALHQGVDIVTLTSSSTVQNFVAIVRANGLDPQRLPGNPLYACIGPITEQTAREEGLPNLIVADEFTTAGLIKAIQTRRER